MAGGAAITGALLDVMPTQWRVEWTALAGCGWRYPSLGAMSDRRPRAHVQVNYIYTLILGAQAAQVVGSGAWAMGELIGAVCEGNGREL